MSDVVYVLDSSGFEFNSFEKDHKDFQSAMNSRVEFLKKQALTLKDIESEFWTKIFDRFKERGLIPASLDKEDWHIDIKENFGKKQVFLIKKPDEEKLFREFMEKMMRGKWRQ